MIFLTTAVEIGEELLNRCIVLTVNEDRGRRGRFTRSSGNGKPWTGS